MNSFYILSNLMVFDGVCAEQRLCTLFVYWRTNSANEMLGIFKVIYDGDT